MTVPSAYPKPVPRGGLRQADGAHSLRGSVGTDVRQPYLGGAPQVVSVAGLGAGASAGIVNNGSDADQSQGLITVRCGAAPTAAATVVLQFGSTVTAGQYWTASPWGSIVQTPSGNQLTLALTAAGVPRPFEVFSIAYQWAVSR